MDHELTGWARLVCICFVSLIVGACFAITISAIFHGNREKRELLDRCIALQDGAPAECHYAVYGR